MVNLFVIDIDGIKTSLSNIGSYRLVPHSDWIEVEDLDSDECVRESYVLHQENLAISGPANCSKDQP